MIKKAIQRAFDDYPYYSVRSLVHWLYLSVTSN